MGFSALLALVENEGPPVVAFLVRVVPDLIAFFKGNLQRDALFVSLDAAIDAHHALVRSELRTKFAGQGE